MFDSVLIANRGEIACRIIRTARDMGIRSIAVYSDEDRDALHVRMADEAVHIGGAAASDSYLRVDRIMQAAQDTGAEAIHPGYGFLSERLDLIAACEKAGIVWVGPHQRAIADMGDKIGAKAIAAAAGMPCIPGYAGEDQSDALLVQSARDIGLPVMVKASSGGGGKGMRAVFAEEDLMSAIASAREEAKRSFGDDRLLIEKLVQNPRHIEVQLLGDKQGNLVHLFERDCSVQRNHQKLLEEAPAPNLKDDTREKLYAAALGLGRAIGYDSTGTVEFIMDAESEAFYFLEMNTRLQVEHTVTEEITGLDLVEWQFRVAAGQVLALQQENITSTGHAIEARLTAEDAAAGFRPETGKILHWKPGPGLRADSGIATGSVIGSSYDSMVGKLIAHGKDRHSACKKLVRGLERTEIAGLKTTRLFLRDAILRPAFLESRATTAFLVDEWPEGWCKDAVDLLPVAAILGQISKPVSISPETPWQSLGGFRVLEQAGQAASTAWIAVEDPEHRVTVTGRDQGMSVSAGEKTHQVSVEREEGNVVRVVIDGAAQRYHYLYQDDLTWLQGPDHEACLQVMPLGDYNAAAFDRQAASPDRIAATMPGLVVDIRVKPGDQVQTGDVLVVMESMKLLMDLTAEMDGQVISVNAGAGDSVDAGHLIVQIE